MAQLALISAFLPAPKVRNDRDCRKNATWVSSETNNKCYSELPATSGFYPVQILQRCNNTRLQMGFGKGILLWLLGIPLPIIILLALFWHH
jgi:hypothetical protein